MSVDQNLPEIINEAVQMHCVGPVGWVVLTRPGQINAINDSIRVGVPAALKRLENNDSIHVIVIRGEGERGLCAGADIKEKRGAETSIQVRKRMESSRWIEAVDEVSKPVIVAIHGYCMGGGLELALACDIRFASPNAVLALPETGLGLIPGGGGTQRLSRVISPGHALDLLLTGERLDAERALQIGLVSRVAKSTETLIDEVSTLALQIAGKSPMASVFAKRAARAASEVDLKKGLDLELDLFSLLATTRDAKEAALAFAERRPPQFTGE